MMSVVKILVVEDDPAIRNLVHRYLVSLDYQVESVEDGKTALATFSEFEPNLVILDVRLPDVSGFALCQTIKSKSDAGIIMLTSFTDEASITRGLNAGADDYVTKPFSLQVLTARVAAVLRRIGNLDKSTSSPSILTYGNVVINPGKHIVTFHDRVLPLSVLEFKLLHFLAQNADRVWQRTELIQRIWGYDFLGDPRVIDVHIGNIRRKTAAEIGDVNLIATVRGVGYQFDTAACQEQLLCR